MAEEDYLLDRLLCALAVPSARCATVDSLEALMGSIFDWSSHESQVNTQILFPGSTLAHKPQPTTFHPPGDKLHIGSLMQPDVAPQYVNVQPAAATAAAPRGGHERGQVDGQWMLAQQRPQMQPTPANAYGYSIQTSDATDHARPASAESTFLCNTPDFADNINWQTVLQQHQHQHIVQQQQILSQQTSQQLPQAQMMWAAMQQQQQQQSDQPQQQQRPCHSQMQLSQQQVLLQQPFGATTDPAQPGADLPAADAPGNSSSIAGSEGDDDAASPSHRRQQQQQAARRGPGRPPKKSGNYSKVYLATKRYRQRKKSLVSQLQSDIAVKVKQLQLLEEEQQSLLRRHDALSSAISLHEDLLEHLAAIKISEDDHENHVFDLDFDQSGACKFTTAIGDRDTSSAAAADYMAAGCGPTGGMSRMEATMIGGTLLQQQQQQQQQQHSMHSQEPFAPHILATCARYKQYVTVDCAEATAADIAAAAATKRSTKQQQSGSEGTEYPAFPLNVVELLECVNLLGYHSSNSSCASSAQLTAGQPVGSNLVNMDTGRHDVVQPDFWVKVAQQVVLTREQKQRMAAAYKLLAAAVAKQNQDRVQLQQQLQELLNTDAAASFNICNSSRAGAMPAPSSAAGANIMPSFTAAAAAAAVTKGSTLASTIDFFQQYHGALDRIDWNLIRCRALLVLYGWSLLEVLTNKQKAQLCMASWPYFPVLRAVFGNLLVAFMQQQQQQ